MKIRHTVTPKRAGFTIIELLVVVAIIAVLAGMVLAAVIPMFFMQQQRNTRSILTKVDGALAEQWGEAVKGFNRSQVPPAIQTIFGCSPETAKVIWVKLQLKAAFPMTYAEALDPAYSASLDATSQAQLRAVLGPRPTFLRNIKSTAAKNPATESSACLLLALKQEFGGKKFNAEEAFGANGMKDTDGDGLPEILDGWGNPVFFFRWGTGNTDLDALGRGSVSNLDRDTEDPEHRLMDNVWNPDATVTTGVTRFQSMCHAIRSGSGRRSFFTRPTIVSAGKDGKLGLGWDMSYLGPDADDNVYTFRVR